MIEELKAVLKDARVRQEIKETKTQDEVIKLVTNAGIKKGYNFTTEEVTKLLPQLAITALHELIEEDLLAAARRHHETRGLCCGSW